LEINKIEYYEQNIDKLIEEFEITNPLIESKVKYDIKRIFNSENPYETLRFLFNKNDILIDARIVNNFNFLINDYIYKYTYKLKLKSDKNDVNLHIKKVTESKEKSKKKLDTII